MARMSNPSEFLNRITAPDGSLAPPNTQPGGLQMGPSGSRNALSRINTSVSGQSSFPTAPSPYGNVCSPDDGHPMQVMSRFGSVRGSPTSQGQMPFYSQTQTPTYGALYTPGRTPGSGPSPYEMDASVFPLVQQVTTSATQAASASRRKNDALHVCPIPGCGSTFTRKFNLNGHIRSHTGQRPYHCRAPGCGKQFARSFDLSRHEKLHAGIKPHMCDGCGKAFARADALSRHLRNDAGNGGCASRLSESESTIDGSSLYGGELRHGSRMTEEVGIEASLMRKEGRFKGHVL